MTSAERIAAPCTSGSPFRSLAELETAIRRDLEILAYPAKSWLAPMMAPDGAELLDVAIVGGGHCGLTAAFALMRERVTNIRVIDENPLGQEGPWQSYARMPDLRTRKAVTGTELGYPNLTFRAYFEAREGEPAYQALQRISCEEWAGYLLWLRRLLELPFDNDVRMESLEPEGDLLRLTLRRKTGRSTLYARRVILATGPLSYGGPNIPEPIRDGLPRAAYAHAYEPIDLTALRGKRILVIGGGATAFDNAGTLLEQGAASVEMLVRRPRIPRLSLIRWTDWAGFLNAYADLGDVERWSLMCEIQRNPSPPPIRALRRVEKSADFRIRFDSPVLAARLQGQEIAIDTPQGTVTGDFLLLATGFSVDFGQAPALASIAPDIALWSDRFTPPGGDWGSPRFPVSPYLGRHYEFQEKRPGTAPHLAHIFAFNQSATLSMGPTGRVSGLKYGVRRLMSGVTTSLVRQDFSRHLASVRAFDESDIDGHPWVEAGPPKHEKE
jgi:cation diffusion facilitator CzcD-associated flavoprotein CzcO